MTGVEDTSVERDDEKSARHELVFEDVVEYSLVEIDKALAHTRPDDA